MEISVIIPTYNSANKISFLLDALLKQTFFDFEIIVVVDGSTDNTVAVVEPYKKRFPQFTLMVNENQGRSKTRNAGAKTANSDLLIFYDDDMIPSPDSVNKHYEFHRQHQNSILGGNQVEYHESQKTDIQNYKAWLTEKWTAKFSDNINIISPSNIFYTAANCSIPKNIFEKLKGFDEQLTGPEDFDFAYRAIENNISVFFDRANIAIHIDPITCESYIKKIRLYRQNHQKLIALYPKRKSIVRNSGGFKHIVYGLFAHKLFIQMIDHSNLFKVLPIKIRYRLYSIIIQSLSVEYPEKKL